MLVQIVVEMEDGFTHREEWSASVNGPYTIESALNKANEAYSSKCGHRVSSCDFIIQVKRVTYERVTPISRQ